MIPPLLILEKNKNFFKNFVILVADFEKLVYNNQEIRDFSNFAEVYMKGYLYLEVDDDELGWARCCCNSLKELSRKTGRSIGHLKSSIARHQHDSENKSFYIKVKLISDEEEETPEDPVNKYIEHGYDSRADYLSSLAEEYDVSERVVRAIAQEYGPSEDFDGLVSTLEDMSKGL